MKTSIGQFFNNIFNIFIGVILVFSLTKSNIFFIELEYFSSQCYLERQESLYLKNNNIKTHI